MDPLGTQPPDAGALETLWAARGPVDPDGSKPLPYSYLLGQRYFDLRDRSGTVRAGLGWGRKGPVLVVFDYWRKPLVIARAEDGVRRLALTGSNLSLTIEIDSGGIRLLANQPVGAGRLDLCLARKGCVFSLGTVDCRCVGVTTRFGGKSVRPGGRSMSGADYATGSNGNIC